MTKTDLVAKMAEKSGLSKTATEKALNAFQETVVDAVKKDDKVTLVGFGSFEQAQRNAREGRNPQTGEKIKIPATKVPKFSAGKVFKEAVK
ncbi:HU family DNA-binding protein [Flexistipes sp.]|uniref:HU family DNA-binding protein n=1 Tax=Flexistipes sp. TaxID=3088135 RepID=UPI002E22F790|nr:HU family DNA-binding protein [Flexistipes sp.]